MSPELIDGLARWAAGSPGTEAAVELLIESEFWLGRSEFQQEVLSSLTPDGDGMISIDWRRAAQLANEIQCSRGERFLLLLACSLAEQSIEVAMSDIASVDGRNVKCIQEVLHTARFGWTDD